MKKKLLLIQPTPYDQYGKLVKKKKLYFVGLALPLLAALTPEDFEVELCYETIEDVPFDTAKLGQDGRIIPGNMDRLAGRTAESYAEPKSVDQQILDRIDGIETTEVSRPVGKPTKITVNGQDVTIPAKSKGAIFVDVFDVYPFDMSKVGGKRLVTKINGVDKNFTDALAEGDSVEIYWEK